MRGLLGVAVALIVVMPGVALAQSPDPPKVELGAQVAKSLNAAPPPVAWSLRLTVPLKRRTAIEGTADIQFEPKFESYRRSAREFSVHWRQTVFTSGRWQIFGLLGAGWNRAEYNLPQQIVNGQVFSPGTFVVSEFVAHVGPAVQVELAPWLALRGDLRGSIGDENRGVRGMLGAVIPIRRHRADDPPTPPAPATTIPNPTPKAAGLTPPAAWQRVKPGREVWVTTNTGSLVHGDIAAISSSTLVLRQQSREVTINLDDVRLVEGRDSLKNGFLIGMVPGAVAGGLGGHLLGSALCSGSTTCDDSSETIVLGAVGGAVVSGFIGGMVDSLILGRQTLFRGNTVRLKPVITPTKKAIDVAIRWR